MALDQNIIKRLSFIKYLYKIAVEQSEKPEPLCSASILSFHDSVELFLYLTCEHLNVKVKKNTSFTEYWNLIKNEHPDIQLTQQPSMLRLNEARVALKHRGTLSHKLDIEGYRATATNFFEENTPTIFGINFSTISLVDLVHYEDVRDRLKEAEEMLNKDNLWDATEKVAIAFTQLIDNYDEDKKHFGRSLFFPSELDHKPIVTPVFKESSMQFKLDNYISKLYNPLKKSLKSLQNTVAMLCLGIDYRKYMKFRLYIPEAGKSSFKDGKWSYVAYPTASQLEPSHDAVQFCIDFVIESYLILQQFDFSIPKHF